MKTYTRRGKRGRSVGNGSSENDCYGNVRISKDHEKDAHRCAKLLSLV